MDKIQEISNIRYILFSVVLSLVSYIIWIMMEKHRYWKKHGIPFIEPLPFFGNLLPVIRMKQAIGDLYNLAYRKFPNNKLVGVYEFFKPVLVVRDPELIDKILVKDFNNFVDHPRISDDGAIGNGLFQLDGSQWRSIRQKISPAFTSGKLKHMFDGMLTSSDLMIHRLEDNLNVDYELREVISIYASDVIATTVFGIQINDEISKQKFVTMTLSIFNTTPFRFISTFMLTHFTKLANWLGMKFLENDVADYFSNLILQALRQREEIDYELNDFTQLLLKLKQKRYLDVQMKNNDDNVLAGKEVEKINKVEITEDIIIGQAFQFMNAGFDPVVLTMVNLFYDMSDYPEIRKKVRNSINEVLDKYNGLTYEAVQDMKYLEQCILETLRLHPVVLYLFRLCTKDYYIPEDNLKISKGDKVVIPLKDLQMDPKYYPEPEIYNPDRLCSMKDNFAYLPFGNGPRICIGFRYAMIVMKLGLAKILTNYDITISPKTQLPIEFNKLSFIHLPTNKFLFKVNKI